MRPKTKLPPEVELPAELSPLGRVKEVTKRLLAVPKERLDASTVKANERLAAGGEQQGNGKVGRPRKA